jgi:hypothetical protein
MEGNGRGSRRDFARAFTMFGPAQELNLPFNEAQNAQGDFAAQATS